MGERTCCQCGGSSPGGYDICKPCDHAIMTMWPMVLGDKIARFVRRSEVHAMREIVLDALDNSESVLVEDYVAATRCLRLLAEMAMGEVSGG